MQHSQTVGQDPKVGVKLCQVTSF